MMLSRPPIPALRPFVKTVWVARSEHGRRPGTRERILPTGSASLVFRLWDTPLAAVVHGAHAAHYVRDVSDPTASAGAMLHPGAVELLLGVPADELADTHLPLEAFWGRAVSGARERLLEVRDPAAQLSLFESMLAARLPRVRGLHPAVAHALSRFSSIDGGNVREAVVESGYSHRGFIALFRRAVGLSPKLYLRVLRFQRALARVAADPKASWVELALEAGYSDQPHFVREFRALTGISPSEYRSLAPEQANHVPLGSNSFNTHRSRSKEDASHEDS